jgi:hypothetical protein
MSNTGRISAVFPADLREQLTRSAEANDRSFSGELRQAVREYIEGVGGSLVVPPRPLPATSRVPEEASPAVEARQRAGDEAG